ncbi:G-alpha-domain-containing protein [Auriscalpium vulgare]|uniref:G-alpha-domain-containing protein n=1 Tax=Auriscalpium vulgare TaxID=40419 RepID=A0ACB8S4S1_9AGAM|nr:G-alpha-domain-containing protein [Auriscalpium vulgare]
MKWSYFKRREHVKEELALTDSAAIDAQLRDDARQMSELTKRTALISVIDSGEPGKSIIMRQWHAQTQGLSESDREKYRNTIYSSTMQVVQRILKFMPLAVAPGNQDAYALVMSHTTQFTESRWPNHLRVAIILLSQDKTVREASAYVRDTERYFFTAIERVTSSTYQPSDRDIFYVNRVTKPTGISEFKIHGDNLCYQFVEVREARRSPRRKWLPFFDSATAVVFLVCLSDYDVVIDDEGGTGLQQSLHLFDSVCNTSRQSIILILDDSDVFQDKLKRSPLSDIFADFHGGEDYDEACAFILQKFVMHNKSPPSRTLYAYFSASDDTKQSTFMLNALLDVVRRGKNALTVICDL